MSYIYYIICQATKREKNLKNKLTDYDRLANVIEGAVTRGSGYAASEAANTIDKEFILIRKSDLPSVQPKTLPWNGQTALKARTAGYNGHKPEIYWNRALDFIAVALHAEQEEGKQAERVLAGKREEAYRMLYPRSAPLWCYKDLSDIAKAQIDVVVNLMTQVDELKDGK